MGGMGTMGVGGIHRMRDHWQIVPILFGISLACWHRGGGEAVILAAKKLKNHSAAEPQPKRYCLGLE